MEVVNARDDEGVAEGLDLVLDFRWVSLPLETARSDTRRQPRLLNWSSCRHLAKALELSISAAPRCSLFWLFLRD